MKKKRMAVKRTAGKPLCEMELKVKERYSQKRTMEEINRKFADM